MAVALVGELSQNGGRADVYFDGKKAGQLDAFIGERTHDNALRHAYGLKAGAHTVRIVMRDDADSRSKGSTRVRERRPARRCAGGVRRGDAARRTRLSREAVALDTPSAGVIIDA